MDFIRKNWSRLSLAFLFFIGGVISIVAWINNPGLNTKDAMSSFFNTAMLIATIVFFLGMVGVTIMKSIPDSKKIVSILYMAIGGIITVLLLVYLVVASCYGRTEYILFFGDSAIGSLYLFWVPFIVFGLHPLIKGVTRFIEAESVPAKAIVQPTAQPVTETAAEAPKAPAKKAAPKTPAAK